MNIKNAPHANKDLGQHYLRDQNLIENIASDFKNKASAIIEIGPGPATLTHALSKTNLPLHVVEKDTRFKDKLLECLQESQILFADALKLDWESYLQSINLKGDCNIWLVSNLPYNISAPLFLSFTKVPQIHYMTLMFQKEVGEKICPPLNEKNTASSLNAIGSNFFKVNKMAIVPPGAFAPPPKVESIVLSFERNEAPSVALSEFDDFEEFLRNLFQCKRKQIFKVMQMTYEADIIKNALGECEIPTSVRAETLLIEQVVQLYRTIGRMKKL